MTPPAVTPMKKVYAWLSDEERDTLAEYCKKEGRSMYSVLKEAVGRTIQGESSFPSSVNPKQDSKTVTPLPAAQMVFPKLQETVLNLQRGFDNLNKEFNRISDHELLWKEISEQKAGLMGVIKEVERFKEHFEDTIAAVFEKLKEEGKVRHDFSR